MAVYLKPDKIYALNGVLCKEYLLTKHNPNNINMPKGKMTVIDGTTMHNTERIKVNPATTCAEQYTRATVNGNMGTVRVTAYVDDVEAWICMPFDSPTWHAGQSGKKDANGSERGNYNTLSIECIMDGSGSAADLKARDNAARLAAYFLDTYGGELYTHNYWCNVRNGKKGTVDELNKLNDGYKKCPVFIRPKWDEFKALVRFYRKANTANPSDSGKMYYVQVGAFSVKENAEKFLEKVKKDYPNAFIKVM